MAEAAGLALGAVALASLFSTCLEVMDYFELSQSYEYDYKQACLKVSLLKARLDTLGRTLDIHDDGQEDTEVRRDCWREENIIHKSLQGIAGIFGDAEQLEHKYSLLPRRCRIKVELKRSGSARALKDGPKRRILGRYYGISLIRRSTSWAIRDKRKFDALIDDLEFFISNLEAVSSRLYISPMSSPKMNNEQSVPQVRNDAKKGIRGMGSQASRPVVAVQKDTQQSVVDVPIETSNDQPTTSSHSEEGCFWLIEKMEDCSAAILGLSGGATLAPATGGQRASFRVGVTTGQARVMGGVITDANFDSFFNAISQSR
ncbi:MAG: hypothetical protein M1822_006705 [Bathelium mastoideum]|nr:MAG: hypothetical protein M1822_006705 [Bathelium mastoideum]